MPSAKRSHTRITSGNTRPQKSAKKFVVGAEHDDSENTADGSSDSDMLVDEGQILSTTPTYQGLNNLSDNPFSQYSKMKVGQVIAWPKSLAVIRTQVQYNITPQQGPRIPDQVLRAAAKRNIRSPSPDHIKDEPATTPYIHIGFTPFLNMQIFAFLPNLPLSSCYQQDAARIHHPTLERWTDTVFLPSITNNDPRAPSSWRLANMYQRSPKWFNKDIAPFPVYRLYENHFNQFFTRAWEKILDLSMRVPEFQQPFLLLYSDGQNSPTFYGRQAEDLMQSFHMVWHQHIDMAHIPWPENDLKVDFNYGNSIERTSLPLR